MRKVRPRINHKLPEGTPGWWAKEELFNYTLRFHTACSIPSLGKGPDLPPAPRQTLRYKLIEEEAIKELLPALLDEGDLVKAADGFGDSLVVIIGTCLEYGINLPSAISRALPDYRVPCWMPMPKAEHIGKPWNPFRETWTVRTIRWTLQQKNDYFDQIYRTTPGLLSSGELGSLCTSLKKRVNELLYDIHYKKLDTMPKAAANAFIVLVNAMQRMSIPVDEIMAEIGESNLEKIDPETGKVRKRADGKILKPDGWEPPDIVGVLRAAGYTG